MNPFFKKSTCILAKKSIFLRKFQKIHGSKRNFFKRGDTYRKNFKKFLKKIEKCIILHTYLWKKLNKPFVNFLAVGRKPPIFLNFEKILQICDENSIEKFNLFIFIFENLVEHIEPSEITPFSTTFFSVSGVPPFPLATPLRKFNTFYKNFSVF